jgi:PilZ domain
MSKIFEAVRQAEMTLAKAKAAAAPSQQPDRLQPHLKLPDLQVHGVPPAPSVRPENVERRDKKRSKLKVPIRLRPSDPEQEQQFDQILKTLNTSRNGLYLTAERSCYREGMRLFITFPYSATMPSLHSEYIGQVVRLDQLEDGHHGVAIQLLSSMNLV